MNVKVVVGGPFNKVLTHYNCCWGLFESREFCIMIAVGGPFEGKVLTPYNCYWGPLSKQSNYTLQFP